MRYDRGRFATPRRLGVAQVVTGVQVFVGTHVDRGAGAEEPVPAGQVPGEGLGRIAVAIQVEVVVRHRGIGRGVDR